MRETTADRLGDAGGGERTFEGIGGDEDRPRVIVSRPSTGDKIFRAAVRGSGWSVFLMLSLHIIEIIAWGFGLIWLGLILRPGDAIYFCANAYTTLGYGAVDLDPHWRNISPIIAISGLFTFAWTTSSLVSVMSNHLKLMEQLEQERLQQLQMRADARQAAWDVLHNEKALEHAGKLEARKRKAGASFFVRWRIGREERRHEKEMRKAAVAEMKDILQKEHCAEDDLGQGPPGDSEGRK